MYKTKLLASIDSLSSDEGDINELTAAKLQKALDDKHKWQAIKIAYAVMFFSSVSYSIQMPSIWPYMNIINLSYSKEFLGWVVAAYSVGQLIFCPTFSYIAGKTMHFKLILAISALLAIFGNYLYSVIVDIPGNLEKTISLVAARVIIGISGANIAPIRLFLTLSTTEEERIGPMSILSACQGLGFIIGPGLQAAFVFLGYPGVLETPFLRINMFTASGLFGVVSNVMIFFLIVFLFKERFLKNKELGIKSLISASGIEYQNIEVEKLKMSFNNDYFSAIFMLLAFSICMMSLAVLETTTTPMSMDNFAWTKIDATLINSIILAASGVCSILIFICLKFITKIIKEKYLLIAGFVLILLSAIFMIPMESGAMPIQYINLLINGTTNETSNGIGCNSIIQPWCLTTPALQIWQYGVSIMLFTLGYPAANVLSYVIFSRLINPKAQSLWMGLLTACGSLARIIGPIFISKFYNSWGTQVAFGSWSGIILLFLFSTPLFLWKMSKSEKLKLEKLDVN